MSKKITINDILQSSAGKLNKQLTNLHVSNKEVPNRLKYGNKWIVIDGHKFQSKKEAKRYGELKLLLSLNEIEVLEFQKSYLLIVKNGKERQCVYKADFVYFNKAGEIIVEDVKSPATRKLSTYIIKRKLMKQIYGIEIKEV